MLYGETLHRAYSGLILAASVLIIVYSGYLFGSDQFQIFYKLLIIPLIIITLIKPHIGLIFTIVTLPVLEVLPDVPFLNTTTVFLGGLAFLSYIYYLISNQKRRYILTHPIHWLLLAFILWTVGTHPSVAINAPDRNWLFTLVQLFILLWLAPQLLDTPARQHSFMLMFIVFCVISSITIFQGYFADSQRIALQDYLSARQDGLLGGANTAARYFTIATLFAFHLWFVSDKKFLPRSFLITSVIILVIGVFWTYSRSAMLLLIIASGLFMFLYPNNRSLIAFVLLFIFLIIVIVLPKEILGRFNAISGSVQNETDTVGLRYDLWKNAIRMWLDYPLYGIGIGQFRYNVRHYQLFDRQGHPMPNVGAHNMYLQVLAENGIVGFMLFMIPIGMALFRFWRHENYSDLPLARVWLIVLCILLLGGITKHDSYEKFLWFILGMSLSFGGVNGSEETNRDLM